jgi:hypothetical protein
LFGSRGRPRFFPVGLVRRHGIAACGSRLRRRVRRARAATDARTQCRRAVRGAGVVDMGARTTDARSVDADDVTGNGARRDGRRRRAVPLKK